MTVDFSRLQYEDPAVWDGIKNDPAEPARIAALRALIPADARSILDLGCGIGSLTNTLDAPLVVGADFARMPLRSVARDRVQASAAALPFRAETFDCVVVTEVLEHLDEPTLVAAVAEILRLRPKYLLVSVPYDEDLANEQVRCAGCGHVFNPYHHRWSFGPHALHWLVGAPYCTVRVAHATPLPTRNRWLTRLKRACGVYDRSDTAVCDRCGGAAAPSSGFLYYALGAVGRILYHAKRLAGLTAPYHQVVLLERFGGHRDVFVYTRRERAERDRWRRLHDAAFDRFLDGERRA